MNNIDYFFNPRSVAVIGASREPRKFGRIIMENFVKRFKGDVFPVNPGTGKVMNRTCYDSVKDIPYEVDLAVIVIPARYVEGVL
ncbi:MAG: CoA-binding protein, partial [Candidatus Altiarchaeales archaeon]|nr:CoA-binding protein [Candidatus Altiarchaeales archaeon]